MLRQREQSQGSDSYTLRARGADTAEPHSQPLEHPQKAISAMVLDASAPTRPGGRPTSAESKASWYDKIPPDQRWEGAENSQDSELDFFYACFTPRSSAQKNIQLFGLGKVEGDLPAITTSIPTCKPTNAVT